MKLPVAIAVLFLVLAANTEAQSAEAEPTFEQHFENFGGQVKAVAEDLSKKTKNAFEDIHNSDFAVNTRAWFTEQFQKVKKTFEQQ